MVRPEKRYELQWLRALAASEVVVCHSDLLTKHFSNFRIGSLTWYYPLSGMEIELFFVLSGYIICIRAPSITMVGVSCRRASSASIRCIPIFTSLALVAYFINPAWRLARAPTSICYISSRNHISDPPAGRISIAHGWAGPWSTRCSSMSPSHS